MKKKLFLLILNSQFLILNSFAQAPNWLWANSAGVSGIDDSKSIAVDGSGNSYVTGRFNSSSITFGTTTLTNAGNQDVFLVKYDAGGNVLWAKSAGGSGADLGLSIAIDGSGSCYVTGYFTSTSITFGTTALTNTGGFDIFLVKYDTGGNVVWASSAAGSSSDYSNSIAVDGSGNSYITGWFNSPSITFGTTTLPNAATPYNDIFIAKYDAGGNAVWAKSAGGSGGDYGNSIAVDGSGNSYVTGSFSSPSVTFGTTTLTNTGIFDIFIVKYDTGGNVVWASSAGGTDDDSGNSIAVDGSGSSYVTGYFQDPSITFGTTTLTNANAAAYDFFLVKYDAGGNAVWASSAGGSVDEVVSSISVDGSGSSYVTGSFTSPSVTFGTTTLTNAGNNDIFIVKYDAGGNAVWAKSVGGSNQDYSMSIAVDGSGSSYVTGSFASPSITFGTTALTNAGSYDMFVAKLENTITGNNEIENFGDDILIYPNPLTKETTISFSLTQKEKLSIKIFDVRGRLISALADEIFEAGENEFKWDASDVKNGVYFLRMETESCAETKKLSIIK